MFKGSPGYTSAGTGCKLIRNAERYAAVCLLMQLSLTLLRRLSYLICLERARGAVMGHACNTSAAHDTPLQSSAGIESSARSFVSEQVVFFCFVPVARPCPRFWASKRAYSASGAADRASQSRAKTLGYIRRYLISVWRAVYG